MTSFERLLEQLERALAAKAGGPSYAERLHLAIQHARGRILLGLPAVEPPMVNPEADPLGARIRWVWERKRDGHAPYYPAP